MENGNLQKNTSKQKSSSDDDLAAQDRLSGRIGNAAMKILRPLARLFIAQGLTFGDAEKILKQAFFDAGTKELERSGIGLNMSRLSVSTGLHRKDIRRFVEQREQGQAAVQEPMRSLASELYTRWVTDRELTRDGSAIDLPLRAEPGSVSFEWLARQISTDAHARSLLEDLKRLGLVAITDDGKVRVNAGGFIPILERTEMLELLGDNLADHLDTAVGNVLDDGDKRLEQSVFVGGLSANAIDQLDTIARPIWVSVMNKIVAAMKQAGKRHPVSTDQPTYRVRTGMYFFTDQPRKSNQTNAVAAVSVMQAIKRPRSQS